jgi:hypothetical protein
MKMLSKEQAFRKMKKWQKHDPPCRLLWLEVKPSAVEGGTISTASGPSVFIRDVSVAREMVWLDNTRREIPVNLRDARFRADPQTGELEVDSPGKSLYLLCEFDSSTCSAEAPIS